MSRCARCRRPFEPARTGRRRRFCSDACRRAAYRARRARRAAFYARTGGDEWATPPGLVAELEAEFGCFELDPCATRETAKAPCFYTRADDGLARPWAGRVFCNPPYSEAGRWLARAWLASVAEGVLAVVLVPARTGSRWWHEWALRGEVRFLRGRLRFGDGRGPAPFPSALVVFRPAFRTRDGRDERRDERRGGRAA